MDANLFWNRVFFLAFTFFSFCLPTKAQISPDGTTATDVNTPDGNNFDINGGNRAGGNLFHSFGNFSVPNGGSANFLNPTDINNIIGRVTGGNISTIDGLIKANGTANLFLINPAGIIFGEGASLSIGGSFLGSTADSLLFNDGTEFSAVNASGKPLLTINAPIGFSVRDNPNPININSQAGLRVQPGKSVTLVGGNLSFDSGKIFAPGGRIELGSLGGAGKIGIGENGSLAFSENVIRGDISLTNGANLNVRGDGSGFIEINARNLELSGRSQVIAGIDEERGTAETKAGNIIINATDSVKLIGEQTAFSQTDDRYKESDNIDQSTSLETNQNTLIRNSVGVPSEQRNPQSDRSTAKGNGGDITVNTKNLELINVATIDTSLYGEGNAGNININAEQISLDGGRSLISSQVKGADFNIIKEQATGNAGNVNINTNNLFLNNIAQIFTYLGKGSTGNAGTININAKNRVTLDTNSIILAEVRENAIGNAGKIDITTGNLSLRKNSLILAQTKANGNAGNIFINAKDRVDLDGISLILASVEPDGQGNAGNINITADNLTLTNRSFLIADTTGIGDAGNVIINARENVYLDGESEIVTATGIRGTNVSGNAGKIYISAKSIFLNDFSIVTVSTNKNTISGKASDLNIKADSLRISNGAIINALTENNSDAGDININVQNLDLTSGGKIIAATNGGGQAGNINLNVAKNFNIDGSNTPSISSLNQFPERNLQFDEPLLQSLVPFTGVFANATPESTGISGNIFVRSNNLNLDNRATISAATNFGEGGNINLKVDKILRLDRNSLISAKASQNASGGNLTIDAKFIVASPNQNSDIVANAEKGKGGNINIATEGIFGLQEEKSTPPNKTNDIDTSSEFGLEGNVSITNPDVSPTQGFIFSPETVVTPEEVAAQVCSASENVANSSSFTITGRGGMPDDPTKPLNSIVIAGNLKAEGQGRRGDEGTGRRGDGETRGRGDSIGLDKKKKTFSSDEIIPARGAIVNEKGQVVLTAYPTPNTPERNYSNVIECNI